jgi:plasmid maintenance system antidote protein VapI
MLSRIPHSETGMWDGSPARTRQPNHVLSKGGAKMNVRQKKLELIEAMNRARALEPSSFVPNKLLDTLIEKMNLKNDAELCRVLEVQPPIISKIRHRKLAVGATILLRMHEKSDISIRELKELSTASMH